MPLFLLAWFLVGGLVTAQTGIPLGRLFPARNTNPVRVPPNSSFSGFPNFTFNSPNLVYYGGPVISHIKVFTIFWGSSVNYAPQINQFYSALVNSPYLDWLSEYNTASQSIGRGTFLGSYNYTAGATGTITDSTIQTGLQNLISAGLVPTFNGSLLYAIHFAPGISISSQGSGSCVDGGFCAYHSSMGTAGAPIYYSVVPDQGGGCQGGCGASSDPFANLCSVSSHELAEAITDAEIGFVTDTSTISGLGAWYDMNNGEIADICASLNPNGDQGQVVGGDGQTYTVQQLWSNKYGSCIVSVPGAAINPAPTPVPPAPTLPPTPAPTPPPPVAVFLQLGHFPVGALPFRANVNPHTGSVKKVNVACTSLQTNTTCDQTKTQSLLHGKAFGFAPSGPNKVLLYQLPADSNVTLTITPAPNQAIFLYMLKWPSGIYQFTKGQYKKKSASNLGEVGPSRVHVPVGKTFSGILKFQKTHFIAWNRQGAPTNATLQFTLAYVVTPV